MGGVFSKSLEGATMEENVPLRPTTEYYSNVSLLELLKRYYDKGRNLMVIEATNGNCEQVKMLLAKGLDPNSSHEGNLAVTFAYGEKHFDVVLLLLQHGSKFPAGFNADDTNHPGLKEYVKVIREFFQELRSTSGVSEEYLKKFFDLYPYNRPIFDVDNESFNRSAVFVAYNGNYRNIKNLIQLLDKFNIRPTTEEIRLIKESSKRSNNSGVLYFNQISTDLFHMPDTMCSHCFFGKNLENDDESSRYEMAKDMFDEINQILTVQPVLSFLTTINCNFKIHFDFEGDCTMSDFSGSKKWIFFGARALKSENITERLRSYGIIARELTLLALTQLPPLELPDETFEECSTISTKGKETFIKDVFEKKLGVDKRMQLISAVPQIDVAYSSDEEFLESRKKLLTSLFKFYETTVVKHLKDGKISFVDKIEEAKQKSPRKTIREKARKNRWIITLSIILGLVLIGLGGYFLLRNTEENTLDLSGYHDCGEVKVRDPSGRDLIVGPDAKDAYKGQWPWLGQLYKYWNEEEIKLFISEGIEIADKVKGYICGASLISQWHLVTAAHCVHEHKAQDFFVLLGRFNLSHDNESTSISRNLSEVIIHDNFNSSRAVFKSQADIAVIGMVQRVDFTEFIQRVCLPRPDEMVLDLRGFVAGYGKSSYADLHEITPKYIEMKSIGSAKCIFLNANFVSVVSEKSFCAEHLNKTASPCMGDSGGGFYVKMEGNRYVMTGVVSKAINARECDPEFPVVFINVLEYREWITKQVTSQKEGKEFVDPCTLNPCVKNQTCKLNKSGEPVCGA